MAKIEIKDERSDLDPTPSIREIAQALKHGTITIVPNMHCQPGYPIMWVSLTDLAKIKRGLSDQIKKDPSGAV